MFRILATMTAVFFMTAFTVADAHPNRPRPPRPAPSTILIGSFSSGSPFNWDNDTVRNSHGGRWYSIALELERGSDVEVSEIQVNCRRGRVCYYARVNDVLSQRRLVWVDFDHALAIESVRVRTKPSGISIPPARVNVYLNR